MPGNTITTHTHYFCQIVENVHQTGEKKFNPFLKQKKWETRMYCMQVCKLCRYWSRSAKEISLQSNVHNLKCICLYT